MNSAQHDYLLHQLRKVVKRPLALSDVRQQKITLSILTQTRLLEHLDITNNNAKYAPFQVVDFFSGAGGMSLGFLALSNLLPSFKLVGACDINADALKSYTANVGKHAIVENIRNLVDDEGLFQNFVSQLTDYDQSKPTVVIGCAPCQGFTAHRKVNWNEDDERNHLFTIFPRVAVKLNPECIVIENVPEVLSEKYWHYFGDVETFLEAQGYIVNQAIFNSAAFGVPQQRYRAIIIAMKKDFLMPEATIKDVRQYSTVRDAIEHLPSVKPGKAHVQDKFHRSASHKKSTINTIKAVPKNGGNRPKGIGPKSLDRVKGFTDVYGRLSWDKPAITITRYARNPASGRFVHPEQDRGLTMREAALLQSFPSWFDFYGTFDSVFKQIGEAVPPKLACAIAASVFLELIAPPLDSEEMSTNLVTEPVSNSFTKMVASLSLDS